MKCSIALATFNGEKYIREQLESFAAQSVLPSELIICDDGSTDGTVDIVSRFKKIAPFKVHFIQNEKNIGHVQNFAKAMSICRGDIVFLADQDDKWFSNKIDSVMRVFRKNPNLWIVVHDGELTDWQLSSTGQTKMSQIRKGYGTAENISTGALSAIRRDLMRYCLPIPAGITAHDSWCHQVASLLRGRRLVLEQTLQYIRRHESNTSSWIVNTDKALNRFSVIHAESKLAPADDYTDRLLLNDGLADVIDQMLDDLTDLADLREIQRAKARLKRERKAIYSRQYLIGLGPLRRKLYANYLLISGQYKHFNGLFSFIRDISR